MSVYAQGKTNKINFRTSKSQLSFASFKNIFEIIVFILMRSIPQYLWDNCVHFDQDYTIESHTKLKVDEFGKLAKVFRWFVSLHLLKCLLYIHEWEKHVMFIYGIATQVTCVTLTCWMTSPWKPSSLRVILLLPLGMSHTRPPLRVSTLLFSPPGRLLR